MRKFWKVAVAGLLALVAVTSLSACARTTAKNSWPRIEKTKKVVIGLDDTFVPMGFREKNGQLEGFDIDLAKAVFKRYGIKADFQTIDWSMKETELRNQTIDLIWNGYTVTPEREKQVLFSDTYLKNYQVLVTKRSDNIKSFADMAGKTVGAQTDSSGAADIDAEPKKLKDIIKGKEPVLYDTYDKAFIDLNAGRIQGIAIDGVYARYYVAHQPNPKKYRIVDGTFPAEKFAVGMRKGDTQLAAKINASLKVLQKDGTIAKLQRKWFGEATQ